MQTAFSKSRERGDGDWGRRLDVESRRRASQGASGRWNRRFRTGPGTPLQPYSASACCDRRKLLLPHAEQYQRPGRGDCPTRQPANAVLKTVRQCAASDARVFRARTMCMECPGKRTQVAVPANSKIADLYSFGRSFAPSVAPLRGALRRPVDSLPRFSRLLWRRWLTGAALFGRGPGALIGMNLRWQSSSPFDQQKSAFHRALAERGRRTQLRVA